MGLDQGTSGAIGAAGPSCDLAQHLIGSLARSWVAALQTQISIDHPNQSEVWEVMAFGDDLGADQNVDLALLHPRHQLPNRLWVVGGVGGENLNACIGEAFGGFGCNAFDAGSNRDQPIFGPTIWASIGLAHRKASEVTDQAVGIFMLNQPRFSIGCLHPMSALAAQNHRRITATVQEQQHLLALFQCLRHRLHQHRAQPLIALRRMVLQVDQTDIWQQRHAIAAGQEQSPAQW